MFAVTFWSHTNKETYRQQPNITVKQIWSIKNLGIKNKMYNLLIKCFFIIKKTVEANKQKA